MSLHDSPADLTYTPDYFASREASPLFAFEMELLTAGLRDKNVLEVGCGSGLVGRRLVELGVASYTGTDVVAQPGAEPDLLCDAAQIPVSADAFDAVIGQHVVEHLLAPRAFLIEALRILRPGGVVRFTTPNRIYPDQSIFDDPTHLSVHGARWWDAALAATGYEAITVRTLFPYLGHPKLLYQSVRVSRLLGSVGRLGAVVFAEAHRPHSAPPSR